MKPSLDFAAFGWFLLGLTTLVTAAERPGSATLVGAARVNITPSQPIRLSGYLNRNRETSKVDQPIWAKALAIGGSSDTADTSILLSVDNLGVSDTIVSAVADRLRTAHGIRRERFALASSHTHSAPCLTGVAPNIFGKKIEPREQKVIDEYTQELTEKLILVAEEALKNRRPGQLSWSRGNVEFAANRRTKGGPVDHDLPVLRAIDEAGRLVAIVVNYACHCTTLKPEDNTISGDWAGYAQEAIERNHPGVVALTLIGCGADANPTRRLEPDAAQDHGRAIADEVDRLLAGQWKPITAAPTGNLKRIKLEFGPLPTREQLLATIEKGGPAGYNASTQLAKLDRGEGLQQELDYPVQTWRFGDGLAMVFLPGEVVVDYVLRLKRDLDADRLWVTAYANDVPCYIPSERILREGGYEGGGAMIYYGRPSPFKPGLENRIVSTVKSLLPESFRAKPARASDDHSAVDDSPKALSPEEALRAFHLPRGIRIELVAGEPLVVDPVAVDFGSDGKLWVCEMRDYPTGIDRNWKPGGVIKFLEDRDSDGRFESATEFLAEIPFPTGVMAWRGGVLICAAPDILFAEDTNGDGRADRVRKLFEGFATENYQARVNGLFYAIDNWVYGANGLIGGSIKGTVSGRVVNIGGRDFRILPDSGAFEAAAGLTQQGRTQDDWGNQFGGNNSILIQHYPFPDHYARRNPRVASPNPSVFIPKGPDHTRLFPTSRTLARYNEPRSANHVTSACSPMIYRDDLLGTDLYGNAFTCEPVHNLVHREVLTPDGITFAGHRAADEQSSEFLSSTDNWFRPVQVRTGPDGAIWVVDMYRFVIEHPRWIDPARLAHLDVRAGEDKGRIYRLVPVNRPLRKVSALDRLSTPELARELESSNGTLRDTAQRLLAHRGDREAIPVLTDLATRGKLPQTRLQALCTLDALGGLTGNLIETAINDSHPGVRRQAIRLAEPWFDRDAAIGSAASRHADDPDPTVRFQLALSLGAWNNPAVARTLAELALRSPVDSWTLAAVLSSATHQADRILREALEIQAPPELRMKLIVPLIATVAGRHERNIDRLRQAVSSLTQPRPGGGFEPWQISALSRLFETGLGRDVFPTGVPSAILNHARTLVKDRKAPTENRIAAIGLLARSPSTLDEDGRIIADLASSDWPISGHGDLARALDRLGADRGIEIFQDHWRQWGPGLRLAILDVFATRAESMAVILEAISNSTISASEIDASHREQFLKHPDPAIRHRATKLLASRVIGDRKQVLERYLASASKPGDAIRGKSIFHKTCSTCHRFGGEGFEVGPDLSALTETSPEAYLTAILEPSRDVDARYASYVAALSDGRILNGLIAAETANAITLKRQGGVSDVILRADLEALKTTGQSLMPDGLENDIRPEAMSDLIAYLQTRGVQPKAVPGNHPETVHQRETGAIRLAAAQAEIIGPTLTFEPAEKNLGLWHSPDDWAAWTFEVSQPGAYTVSMEWACADESAGNLFVFRVGNQSKVCDVGGTGANTWANYRTIFLDEIALEAGIHRLEIRPVGEVHNALMDLRAVFLTPRSVTPRNIP
jgi:putative membrane-bound dehydrogenase-like protein